MQKIYDFSVDVQNKEGRSYAVRLYGAPRADRHWSGFILFIPADNGPILATGVETVQADINSLLYWAGGLTPTYLEGALARASPRESELEAAV